ncbi:MAG: hypothetical protein IJM64_09115 [Ottowia sp.]|nr:hypothetical protein [Ottowia sp.]
MTTPRLAALAAAALLAACSTTEPVPDWKTNALASIERATEHHLQGKTRQAAGEWRKARQDISATGRLDLLARLELNACAARTAGLDFGECAAFAPLAEDAGDDDRAYARYLAAALQEGDAALLPAAHQGAAAAIAAATPEAAEQAAAAIADPYARLIAAAVLLHAGLGSDALAQLAADTASAQGWRRPLLAWLQLLTRSQNADTAALATRRIQMMERQGAPAGE